MSSGREGGGGGGSGPTNRKPKHAARRMSKEKFKPVQTSSNESTGSSDRTAGTGQSGPPGGGGSASVAALQPVAPDDSSDIIISAAPVPVVKSNANNLNNESGGGGGGASGGATSGNATTQPMAHSQSKRFNPKSTIKKSNYRVKSCQKSCVSKRPKSKPANGFGRKKSREAMTHASVERCAKSPDTDRSTSEGAFSFDANLDEETKRKFYEHFMATIEFFEKEKNLYMAKSSHKASMISNKIRAAKPNAGERTGSSKPKSKGHTISKEFLSSTAKVASSVKKSKRPKSAQRSFSKSKLVLCPSIDHSAPAPMPSVAVAQPPMTTPQPLPTPQSLLAQPPSPLAQPQLQVPSNNKMMMMMTTAFHSKQPQIALIAQTPAPAAVVPAAPPVPLPPAAGTDPASAMAAAAGGVGGVNAGNPTTIIITNFSNENDALKMFNNFIQNMNMNNQNSPNLIATNNNGNSNSNNTNNLINNNLNTNNLNFNNLNPNNLTNNNNNNPNPNNNSSNNSNNNNIIINSNNPNFSVPVQRSKNHLIQMAPEPQMVAAPPADNDIITERAKLEELYDELTDLMTNSNTIHHSYEQIVQSLVNLQRRNRTSANKGKVTMLPHSAESSILLGPPNPTGTGTGLAPGVDIQDIDRFMNPSTRNEAFKELFAQVDTLKEKMAHFHRCFDDEGNLDENRYAESIRVTYRQSIEWHRDMQELGKIVENILRQYNKDVLELFRLSQCE